MSEPTKEQQQRIVRFANTLREIPHREHCPRTKGLSHKCGCDVGEPISKVYNQFLEAMGLG